MTAHTGCELEMGDGRSGAFYVNGPKGVCLALGGWWLGVGAGNGTRWENEYD